LGHPIQSKGWNPETRFGQTAGMKTQQTQQDELILTNPEAARALRDSTIFPQFLEPKSPSEVAKKTGMAANLVHYHANRLLELGLLFEAGREDGRVLYQTVARTIKHADSLLGTEMRSNTMNVLSEAFLNAYEHSSHLAGDDSTEFHIYSIAKASEPLERQRPDFTDVQTAEPRPAHFQSRTLKLSSEQYQAFIGKVAKLMLELEAETDKNAEQCTFTFIGFDGVMREGFADSQTIDSFVPVTT
jgi:hypothetical protein